MFQATKIKQWVKEFYNWEVEVTKLPGYEEWNYKIKNQNGDFYTLKMGELENNRSILEAQQAVISHLSEYLPNALPKQVLNKQGQGITFLKCENKEFYIRILKFLQGTFIGELKNPSLETYQNLGVFLGKMDLNLRGFYHPGAYRYLDWDLKNALDWEESATQIKSHEKRRLVQYFLMQFREKVLPVQAQLRHQIIHNDANDWNVLTRGNQIAGIIDFGDTVYAPLINNLAIGLTYVVLGKEQPLEVAKAMIKSYHSVCPLIEKEVDLLYYLIAARLCVSVIQSAVKRAEGSSNEHHFVTEKQAWELLEKWIQINPLKVVQEFRKACGMPLLYEENKNYDALLARRNQHIGQNLSVSYQTPLKIVKGALQYLYDDQGKTYIDCVNNVSHVGHCHPVLVKSMQRQIATLNTNTRYLHDKLVEYAEELCHTLPEKLNTCYFVNSGSEANDLAIRMARHYTGNNDIIVLDSAYHGTSTLALEMSPYKFDGKGGFQQKEYIHKVTSPDPYRGVFRYGDPDKGKKYAHEVGEKIQQLLRDDKPPAAFICETLLGVGGQIPLPADYLKGVYQYVREAGGVTIADEVQVGFGRVGSAFWGFELQEVVPDIVVLGKPIGNGHPLAAVVVTQEIAAAFDNGMEYFNTFGGNPVSMSTGLAVLRIIQNEELQENAKNVGDYLLNKFQKLKDKYEFIGDVRGKGLFVGVEFVKDRRTLEPESELLNRVVEKMKSRGFLLSTDGPLNNVLKIKPPLVFDRKNAEQLLLNIEEVLENLNE